MSRYENWAPERIEEYRRKNREKIKQRRLEKGRDRTKENASRRERYKTDPVYRAKKIEERKNRKPVDKTDPNYIKKMQEINQEYRTKRMALKKQCISYLGDKCLHCKNEFHPNVYDFHHKNPEEKEINISILMDKEKCKMTERLKQELDKCELLCSNCHRIVHILDS